MQSKIDRNTLLTLILQREGDYTDEQLIHLLLAHQTSAKTTDLSTTFKDKIADMIASFVGSWSFIISFTAIILIWMITNAVLLLNGGFDPYPFILLNLILSCVAAIQAPLIMMSQNRQEKKDRLREECGYIVNLKNEVILKDLHHKIDSILDLLNVGEAD